MKARVKATGEIVEVEYNLMYGSNGVPPYVQRDENGEPIAQYIADQLSWDIYDPDYWTRLEHQYAGMAMQGILACEEWKISPREGVSFAGEVALQAQEIAHALVEKMKEEREG